ncbi:hypothetical protein GGX14DRAFT_650915 [Mycena pura]|uniref:Uncharacterized protein n=1 Tax=Mycena pura TaxID=153505 RepID=A0AAD7E338_9AGAR|nr:hypothetical protein GGX14DRAFT_650915 [Mycena pura]
MDSWCFDECMHCARVVVGSDSYCSPECDAAAGARRLELDSDDDYEDANSASYTSWHRVCLWAQNVDSAPPPASSPAHLSPSERILTPQYPTACLTCESSPESLPSKRRGSPPRVARALTATNSLVASSTASPMSFGERVWAPRRPRPQLPRLTTANFTMFAKANPPLRQPSSDESEADNVWWLGREAHTSTSPSSHFIEQRRAPPARGRHLGPAVA